MDTKKCICCGEIKSIYQFNLVLGTTNERVALCKQCSLYYNAEIRAKLETKCINCRYPSTRCKYSREDYLCCHECPKMQYCEFRCLNNPELCGCKNG